jgi:hypothetical protein
MAEFLKKSKNVRYLTVLNSFSVLNTKADEKLLFVRAEQSLHTSSEQGPNRNTVTALKLK